MNRNLPLILCLIAGAAQCAHPQSAVTGYPFETPSDARSVAMGESFVALPSNPAALIYNPAGLGGFSGADLSYSRKSFDRFIREWSLYSVNAAVGTSFGVFALQYNRISMGRIPVTTVLCPDGDGTELTLYSHDVAFGYAYRFPAGLALGVSAKYFDFVEKVSGPSSASVLTWTSKPAYLFDVGITYTVRRFHSQETVEDSITIGMSYQNLGTQWKAAYRSPGGLITSIDVLPSWTSTELPEFFRAGLSYAMRIRPPEEGALSPFAGVFSGEFRSLQAPLPLDVGGGYLPTESTPLGPGPRYHGTSYWGLGLECTIFEFVSVRGGAAFKPFFSLEADRDRPSFRYGGGIHLPLRRIGLDVPLTASFQYAVVPVSEPGFFGDTSVRAGTFPVFSLELHHSFN